ncbi:hypothetical protein [Amycolatopsis solani]|uniref:hypothetical protein n=1 Tax=Amycolatopsis solani TaxID=3028615 RepID=UPI0025B11B56|nr:hypothetical protein [Amycolatopsis sp. MEP2-6]
MTQPGFRWDPAARVALGDALARLGPNRCAVEVTADEVVLAEPPARRDRARNSALLECGAALSTVWTVLRVLGRDPVLVFPRNPDRPDVAVVVRGGGPRSPSNAEWTRYLALRRLTEPARGTVLRPVSLAVLTALAGEDFWPDTDVRIVRPAWASTLKRLGADLAGRSSLLVTTPGDTRRHHVLAGAALHATRLAAAARGLGSERVPLISLATVERARHTQVLPGVPQGLLLVGLASRRPTGPPGTWRHASQAG